MERDSFDLVVVGGGITGAGVALDAASRGYSVALVEKSDFAAGTSSRSSKLVHGGLRYLQNFDLGLVREALLERSLLVKLAPHLVRPLPFIVPTFEGKRPDRMLGMGLNMYDVMSWRRGRGRDEAEEWSPERHRTIDGPEVVDFVPALAAREPTGGYLFYDCQTDDARLVLTVLGEAERFGAVIANRCEVTGLVERGGRAAGVLVRDGLGDGEFELCADNVVNATGVWADRIRPQELYAEEEMPVIRPSRGTHITLPRELVDVRAGAIVPAGGGRTVFVLPWLGRTLVGTTDNDYEGSVEHVPPADEDVAYLLEAVNAFFATDLGPGDLSGAYAGVRPLISTGDPKKSVDISRKAELYETSSGLVTITGGKLTTWRRMAKLAVDRVVDREGREAPCRTQEIQLGMPVDAASLPEAAGVERGDAGASCVPIRTRGEPGDEARGGRSRAGRADLARPAGHRRRGGLRGRPRAGALGGRRAAAPDAPRAARRPAPLRGGRRRAREGGARDGRPARLGRRAGGAGAGGLARGGRCRGTGSLSDNRARHAARREDPSPTAPGAAPEEAA